MVGSSNHQDQDDARPVDRRRVLRMTGGTLLAATATGPVSSASVGGTAGFDSEDETIDSFDGTPIAATLYEPNSSGPHPAIVMTHGWGGNRGQLTELAERYAGAGYAVLTFDMRGFGESGGTVTLDGEDEPRDLSALLDWLEDEAVVADDPSIGMDGRSYGGGIQLLGAAHDDRIDAIVPRITWNDLQYALAPDGVVKVSWQTALLAAGGASTYELSGGSSIGDNVVDWYTEALKTNEIPEEAAEQNEQGSITGREEQVDAATLVISGWDDTLFKPSEALWNYRGIAADGTETALVLYPGGHDVSEVSMSDEARAHMDDLAMKWLDNHVRGEDHEIPEVSLYLEQTEEWRTHERFPPADATERSFPLADGVRGPESSIHRSELFTSDTQSFTWQFDEPVEICGSPTYDLYLDVEGPEARLFFEFFDESGVFGSEKIGTGEVYRLDEPGIHHVTFENPPIQRFFDPGGELTLEISASNAYYLDSRESDGVTILHDEEYPSSVTLPVR